MYFIDFFYVLLWKVFYTCRIQKEMAVPLLLPLSQTPLSYN